MEKTMNKQAFAELAAEEVIKLLPEGYTATVQEITKVNSAYTGVVVKKAGSNVAPSLNADAYYGMYVGGTCLKDIFEEMAEAASRAMPSYAMNLGEMLKDYDSVKEKLFAKTFATEKVEGMVHREVVDGISIVPYILINETQEQVAMARVTKDLLEIWDVDEEEAIDAAIENGRRMYPSVIARASDSFPDGNGMFIITNTKMHGGATALFYGGTLEQAREAIGSDYFILPSSVDEFIAVPYKRIIDPEELLDLVKIVNSTMEPEMILTEAVYSYRDGQLRREA